MQGVDDFIFALGGREGNKTMAEIRCFDLNAQMKAWKPLLKVELPAKLCWACAVVTNKEGDKNKKILHCIGGVNEKSQNTNLHFQIPLRFIVRNDLGVLVFSYWFRVKGGFNIRGYGKTLGGIINKYVGGNGIVNLRSL